MENVNEVMKQIHEHQVKSKTDENYVEAAVTMSHTVGFTGATLNGWITYNDSRLGKIEFHSTVITQHSWFFAGAGALPSFQVRLPEQFKNEGEFSSSGSVPGGTLMLFNADGTPLFPIAFPVAGAGAPYWSAHGKVHFTIHK